jgi:hypothetical protein
MKKNSILLALAGVLPFAVQGATLTVNTASNFESPDDGLLSFVEALKEAGPGDTIVFNIPGPGPHHLATPPDGYPLITAGNLTIDGYSQPGSSANTHSILEGNNALIKIVLDSRNGARRRLGPLNNPGYGNSESCILGFYNAANVLVRGLSFLGLHTNGSDADPAIYCVAFLDDCPNARLQGNWFGLSPDGSTSGCGSAVANFGGNGGTYATGLIIGTDGDGDGDRGEFNLMIAMGLAVNLQTPNVRLSGNYINVYPDGVSFFDIQALADEIGGTIGAIENGRGFNMLIGTDGNGVSDAEERNIIGHAVYPRIVEFWGAAATNVVIAGNYFGVGVDGLSLAPVPISRSPDFVLIKSKGSIRIGSNSDGISDNLEGNLFYNVKGARFANLLSGNSGANITKVVARLNKFVNNGFTRILFPNGPDGITYAGYYSEVMAAGSPTYEPTVTGLFGTVLQGTIPLAKTANYPRTIVDVYRIDPTASLNGKAQPYELLGSFVEGSTEDGDPVAGGFRFDLAAYTIPDGAKLAVQATYFSGYGTDVGSAVSSPLSEPVAVDGITAAPLAQPRVAVEYGGGSVIVSWAGPEYRFRLESALVLNRTATHWVPVLEPVISDGGNNSVELAATQAPQFLRLVAQTGVQ